MKRLTVDCGSVVVAVVTVVVVTVVEAGQRQRLGKKIAHTYELL